MIYIVVELILYFYRVFLLSLRLASLAVFSVIILASTLIISGNYSKIINIINENNNILKIKNNKLEGDSFCFDLSIRKDNLNLELEKVIFPWIEIDDILLLRSDDFKPKNFITIEKIKLSTTNQSNKKETEKVSKDKNDYFLSDINKKIYKILNLSNRITEYVNLKINNISIEINFNKKKNNYKIKNLSISSDKKTNEIEKFNKNITDCKYINYSLELVSELYQKITQSVSINCKFNKKNKSTEECLLNIVDLPLSVVKLIKEDIDVSGLISSEARLIMHKKMIKKVIFNISQLSESKISTSFINTIKIKPINIKGELIFENNSANLKLDDVDLNAVDLIRTKISSDRNVDEIFLNQGVISPQKITNKLKYDIIKYIQISGEDVKFDSSIKFKNGLNCKTKLDGKNLKINSEFLNFENIEMNLSFENGEISVEILNLVINSKVFNNSLLKNIEGDHLRLNGTRIEIKDNLVKLYFNKSNLKMDSKMYHELIGLNSNLVDNKVVNLQLIGSVEFNLDYTYKENLKIDLNVLNSETKKTADIKIKKDKNSRYIKIATKNTNSTDLYIKNDDFLIIKLGEVRKKEKIEKENIKNANFILKIENLNSFGKKLFLDIITTNNDELITFSADEVRSQIILDLTKDIMNLVDRILSKEKDLDNKQTKLAINGNIRKIYGIDLNNYGTLNCTLETDKEIANSVNIEINFFENEKLNSNLIIKTEENINPKKIIIEFNKIGQILSNFFNINRIINGSGDAEFLINGNIINGFLNLNKFEVRYEKELNKIIHFDKSNSIIKTDLKHSYINSKLSNREFDISVITNINSKEWIDVNGSVRIKTIALDQLTKILLPFARESNHIKFNYHFDLKDNSKDQSDIDINYLKIITLPVTGVSFVINNILGKADKFVLNYQDAKKSN